MKKFNFISSKIGSQKNIFANMKITFLDYSWKFLPSLTPARTYNIEWGIFLFFCFACRSFFSVCCIWKEENWEYEKKINEKIRCIRENSLAKEEKLFKSSYWLKFIVTVALYSLRHILITSCLAKMRMKNSVILWERESYSITPPGTFWKVPFVLQRK